MALQDIYNANNLYNAFLKAKQGTDWKPNVQKYEANVLLNIYKTQQEIKSGTYIPKPLNTFVLSERGHSRLIKSQNIYDRVIQRSFNDNVLVSKTRPMLIYDNGASLKGKGLSFSRKRFEIHLRKAYQEYGDGAYVIIMDYTKYYDNVRHEESLSQFSKVLQPDELDFLKRTFKEFEVDVSYMTDDEYANCMDNVFNALEYKECNEGLKFMRKSIGIGNQSSQIAGVYYATSIDNYCKTVRGIKYYGRYMDDTYIIMRSKKEAQELLPEIMRICASLGIFINPKKTRVCKITSWIPWLKINYKIKNSGGLVRKVHSKTFTRERRKLRQFRRLYQEGRMSFDKVLHNYLSWRGTYRKYDSKKKLYKMDKYFQELFKEAK